MQRQGHSQSMGSVGHMHRTLYGQLRVVVVVVVVVAAGVVVVVAAGVAVSVAVSVAVAVAVAVVVCCCLLLLLLLFLLFLLLGTASGMNVASGSPLLVLSVKRAQWFLNPYSIGSDGKTAYSRRWGKDYQGPLHGWIVEAICEEQCQSAKGCASMVHWHLARQRHRGR